MSTMQRVTLIGLYNYENSFGRDLFRKLSLPEGFDAATFVNALLLEHGEKCVLYNDPEFFVNAIGMWSAKYQLELERIYEALTAEYNPIWNYDRNEEWSDSSGQKYTSTTNAGQKYTSQTNAGHKAKDTPKYDDDVTNDYDIVNKQDYDSTVEHKISADNSSDYSPESKDISNFGQNTTSNDGTIKRHIEGATQDLSESSNSKTEDQTTDNRKVEDQTINNSSHSGHLWGNIGVTTSASMVTEVVKQRFQITLYGVTTKMFANELLIGIW